MARRFFPDGGAIGKRWTYGDPIAADSPLIVGVVEDAKYMDVRGTTPNMIYRLAAAAPADVLGNLEIRTAGAPSLLANTIRQALAEVEPALPVFDVVPLDQRLNRGLTNDRLIANLTSAFGLVALLLACLGLVRHHLVRRGAPHRGARLADGARRRPQERAVAGRPRSHRARRRRRGPRPAARRSRRTQPGVAAARCRSRRSALVRASRPCCLLLVAGLAAYVPAYRASRIDPMVALRSNNFNS